MELLLILNEGSGSHIIELFTYHKLPKNLISNSEPVNIYYSTNKNEINLYKYYIKSSLSDITKMIKNEEVTKIDIITFGDTYKNLTGSEGKKIIEPDKKQKVNIFYLFNFFPFTTSNLETFFLQVPEKLCKYRLNYLYDNVPIIDLNSNKISMELINEVTNLYYNKKLYISNEYDFNHSIPLFFNFLNLETIFENMNFYLPKLSNMNKIELNFDISQEDIITKSANYQKLLFFIRTYSGLFKVSNININLDINSIKYINKLISENFISFDVLEIILNRYPQFINNISFEEVYFSSIIEIKKYFKDNYYNYNFFIELYNHSIYKVIILQKLIMYNILLLSEEFGMEFGVFTNNLITYINEYKLIKNYDKDIFIYYIPYEEEMDEIEKVLKENYEDFSINDLDDIEETIF